MRLGARLLYVKTFRSQDAPQLLLLGYGAMPAINNAEGAGSGLAVRYE